MSSPILPFPSGANATDTLIANTQFNLSTLQHWKYTLYSNSTLSNASACYLVFTPYTPAYLFPNGSFTNATSCYSPINPIGPRGSLSLVFGTFFSITLLFTLVNLGKHGRSHVSSSWTIPGRSRRLKGTLGRKAPWYWMLFTATCGVVSSFTGVDVDRDYLQSTACVLEAFFYTLMLPGLLACAWEACREWYVLIPPFAVHDVICQTLST